MVKYSMNALEATFGALADTTRRAILERLAHGEARVTEVAAPFAVSLPAVSKHLRVLENAGLLVRERKGRNRLCRLNALPMKNATEWLGHYQRYWKNHSNAPERTTPRGSASPGSRQAQSSPAISLAWLVPFNFSVKFNQKTLDATFSALADPTRRAILSCLAFADASVTELAAPFNISLPALTKHLRVLQAAGLVERQKYGRINLCRLVATPMQNAEAWISRYRIFWEKQLDALAEYLEKSKTERQNH